MGKKKKKKKMRSEIRPAISNDFRLSPSVASAHTERRTVIIIIVFFFFFSRSGSHRCDSMGAMCNVPLTCRSWQSQLHQLSRHTKKGNSSSSSSDVYLRKKEEHTHKKSMRAIINWSVEEASWWALLRCRRLFAPRGRRIEGCCCCIYTSLSFLLSLSPFF